MKSKLAQSLPLLGTFLALIIGGAVLFKFTPADAVLDAQAVDVPPVDPVTMPDIEPVSDTIVVTDAEPTMYEATSANAKGKVVTGIYAEANENVTLTDHYLNDVYVAGNSITITGTVEGDVFAAGEHIRIDGTVMGSVRAAGSDIVVNGAVGRNVVAFAGDVQINSNSHVGGDVLVYSGDVQIASMIMGNVTGNAAELLINSVVEGDVNLPSVGALLFGPDAYVMGDVAYTSTHTAQVDEAATLLGNTHYTLAVERKDEPSLMMRAFGTGFKLMFMLIHWLGFLLLGSVLLKLLPKFSHNVITTMRTKPVQSFGYGALLLICAPLVLVFIALTVIGLPLALTGGLAYLLLLIIGKVYAGLAIGMLILKNSKSLVGPFMLGFTIMCLVVAVLSFLGFAGIVLSGLLIGIIFTWALGGLVKTCHHGRNL